LGFVVEANGLVRVEHNINNYGATTPNRNPTNAKTRCENNPLRVFSIFLRRSYGGAGKGKGDNCPFIYAVKGKQNLHVNYSSIKFLNHSMIDILKKFSEQQERDKIKYDLIIPMPSSHQISNILASRLSLYLPDSVIEPGLFRKSTSEDVRGQVEGIPHGARINIINAINKAVESNKNFSLSDVDTQNRKYIFPIEKVAEMKSVKRVLLVDDLFATGTTLITAKNLIKASNPQVIVEAMCLFSPLDGRVRNK
jgi:hypothetical protein